MAIKYPDDNTAMIPELIPNRDLIELRKTFGINPEFLLSDSNQYYTNMNDNMPIEKIDGHFVDKTYALLIIRRPAAHWCPSSHLPRNGPGPNSLRSSQPPPI